jgi:nitrate reductase NapD
MTDLHIASFALRCDPARLADILPALPDHEIGAIDPATGRVVIVVEGPDEAAVLSRLTALQATPGVINAALVYQQILN